MSAIEYFISVRKCVSGRYFFRNQRSESAKQMELISSLFFSWLKKRCEFEHLIRSTRRSFKSCTLKK